MKGKTKAKFLGSVAALGIIGAGAVAGYQHFFHHNWPETVLQLQKTAAKACRNQDVKSEPTQVNVACRTNILWVFALVASRGNPQFAAHGRVGLEPISPDQGSTIAWALNLHHNYDPADPLDSMMVAARTLNNLAGGATIRQHGKLVVDPGLMSSRGNCGRYTGATGRHQRVDYPSECSFKLTPTGAVALARDLFLRWYPSATHRQVAEVATLVAANGPDSPAVQSALRTLCLWGSQCS